MNDECCYPLCGSCPFDDCIRDDILEDELLDQNSFDNGVILDYRRERAYNLNHERQFNYNHSTKGIKRVFKYNQTDKFKAKNKRYNDSAKGKERLNKYKQSKKGRLKAQELAQRRQDMEWLARYYLLYCGKNTKYKKNTNKRQCKAYRLKKQYGVTKEWVLLHYGNRVLDKG